jgi:hypothetical protein
VEDYAEPRLPLLLPGSLLGGLQGLLGLALAVLACTKACKSYISMKSPLNMVQLSGTWSSGRGNCATSSPGRGPRNYSEECRSYVAEFKSIENKQSQPNGL